MAGLPVPGWPRTEPSVPNWSDSWKATRPPWKLEPGTDSEPCCSLLGRQCCRPCYLPDTAIVAQGEKGFVRTAARSLQFNGALYVCTPGMHWMAAMDGEALPPPRTSGQPWAQRGCGRPSSRSQIPPPQPTTLKHEIPPTPKSPVSTR